MSNKSITRRGRRASPKRVSSKRKASTGAAGEKNGKKKPRVTSQPDSDVESEPRINRKATVVSEEEEEEERLKDAEVIEESNSAEGKSDSEGSKEEEEEEEMDEEAIEAELGKDRDFM